MDLFKLVGSVFVDTEKANDSLQKTDEKAKATGTTFGEVAGKAAKVGGAIVGASATAVTGLVKLATNSAATADEIDKGSKRMGVSTDYYQELGYAAGQCGVDMGTLEKAAKKLEGTDINLQQAMAQIMGLGTASERSQKAAELFGESVAYQMAPMLDEGGESFNALINRADELGIVMSEDAVNAGVVLGDTMSDVQQAFGAVATDLGSALMPVVQQFADVLVEFMPYIQDAMANIAPLLSDLFEKLMPPLMELLDQIFPVLMDILNTLLPIIIDLASELLPAIVEIIEAILPIIPPILDIIKEIAPFLIEFVQMILPIIVKLFQKIVPFLVKICEAILPIIAELLPIIMEVLEAIMPILDLILEVIGFLLDVFGDIIKNVLPPIISLLRDILTPILRVIITVISAVGDAFRAAFDGIKAAWEGAGDFFSGLWENIKAAFAAVGEWFSQIFSDAWEAIKKPFVAVGEWFQGVFDKIKEAIKAPINGIIRGINKLIEGLNKIQFTTPDWIPFIGGKTFGFNIGYLNELAEGGQATGIGGSTLVGEEGPEILDLPKGATVIPLKQSSVSIGIDDLNSKMDDLIGIVEALIGQKIGVYLNGRALVGELTPDINTALGQLAVADGRYR